MKVVVRAEAARDIDNIYVWIAKDSPHIARLVVRRLRQRISILAIDSLANIGRPGKDRGTRELVHRPYVIVYEVRPRKKQVEILAVFHVARDR